MNGASTDCPSCGTPGTRRVGPIASSDVFAGRRLERPLPGGDLRECGACRLLFRWPRLAKDRLDDLYRGGLPHRWSQEPSSRADWAIIGRWIAAHAPRCSRLLDVGCSDGAFLASIEAEVERFGLEVQPEAAASAGARGVTIVGNDFASLAARRGEFHVVTAIDVLEHVEAPLAFLELLAGCTTSGGAVLVSSGNTAAPAWRFMGSRYYYCTIPEHISFVSPAWCAQAAAKLGLRVEATMTFSHGVRTLRRRAAECAKNLFYRAAPLVSARLREAGFGRRSTGATAELAMHPPRWDSARDHFVTVFRKP